MRRVLDERCTYRDRVMGIVSNIYRDTILDLAQNLSLVQQENYKYERKKVRRGCKSHAAPTNLLLFGSNN
jgi:hypothetical protein